MNLLLIDSTIPSINTFLEGVNENTKTITYSITDTFESLKEKIDNLQLNTIDNIGFVFVDEQTPLKMFVSFNSFISFDVNGITENNTTNFIKDLVIKYSVKNLDFLACNLLSYPEWKKYFEYLMKKNDGLIVRASNDRTGNLSAGGDWILESTNEDISSLYFNNNISNYNFLLDINTTFTVIQSSDSNLLASGKNSYGELNKGNLQYSKTFAKIYDGGNILKVACGDKYTMLLLNNGELYACGFNQLGRMGISASFDNNVTTFTQVDRTYTTSRYPIDVSCGNWYSMIVMNDGTVWGTGFNQYGQIGNGVSYNFSFAQATRTWPSNLTATKVSCGLDHSCILLSDGTVWGSGSNGSGQIGDGTTVQRTTFTQSTNTYGSTKQVTDLVCGFYHTMIILNDETLWGCGMNNYGQLGLGHNGPSYTFSQSKKSDGNYLTNVKKVGCGRYHSIVKVANSSSTYVYTTGDNEYGSLGSGGIETRDVDKNIFTEVYSNTNSGNAITNIGCGHNQSFYIRSDNTIWACGSGASGQLGLGYSQNYNTAFAQIESPGTGQITDATYIATGTDHTVIIRNSNSEIWGVGIDTEGQLNSTYISKNFTSLTSFDKDTILCAATGSGHTMIVKNDGTVWGCGLNDYGQLGNGTTDNKISFTQALNINNAVNVSCGDKHTIILLNNGNIYGCGLNTNGQLGINNTSSQSVFTKATSSNGEITNAIDISCCSNSTIIIRKSGTSKNIWGCGQNNAGQLGLPTTTATSTIFVESNGSITNAKKISCGLDYTIVLRDNNTIAGTGKNDQYQLGLGHNTTPITQFTANNTPITDINDVSCGYAHTMILKNDGTVWGCGYNGWGQIGDGTSNIKTSFTQITSIVDAISLKCTYNSSFIILRNNKLYASGLNSSGQLGKGNTTSYNVFTEITYPVTKLKIINKKKSNEVNSSSTIQTFNNLENVVSFLPDTITRSINSSIVSASDNTSAFYNVSGRDKVIKLEPAGTIFSDYINFDVTVSNNPASTIVYFKSDSDTQPVRLYQNPVNSYGAYYTIPAGTTNTIRVYTKHFTELGTGTGNFCLLKGTKVLTPDGYQLIENLKYNDLVITDDNREVPIKMIFKTVINANEKPNFIPYKIEKNSISENYPSEDTYLSGYHMIKYGNNWIEPLKCPKFTKDLSIKEIVYYHIQLENYETDNLVVNGGLIVESLTDGTNKDAKIWIERTENSLIIE